MRRIIAVVIAVCIYPAQTTRTIVIAVVVVAGIVPAIGVRRIYVSSVIIAIAVVVVVIGITVHVEIAHRLINHGIGFCTTHNYAAAIWIVIAVPVIITVPVGVK